MITYFENGDIPFTRESLIFFLSIGDEIRKELKNKDITVREQLKLKSELNKWNNDKLRVGQDCSDLFHEFVIHNTELFQKYMYTCNKVVKCSLRLEKDAIWVKQDEKYYDYRTYKSESILIPLDFIFERESYIKRRTEQVVLKRNKDKHERLVANKLKIKQNIIKLDDEYSLCVKDLFYHETDMKIKYEGQNIEWLSSIEHH